MGEGEHLRFRVTLASSTETAAPLLPRFQMTAALRFDPIRLPSECVELRKEVRAFLAEEIAAGTFDPHKPNREDSDAPEFSRRVGARGWIGMTWPKKYGGPESPFLESSVVCAGMRG